MSEVIAGAILCLIVLWASAWFVFFPAVGVLYLLGALN